MSEAQDPIVGHKTMRGENGETRREPVRQSEAAALLAHVEAEKAKRAADMPTDKDAVNALWSAFQRLRELGWNEARYGPADKDVQLIEVGSSGIHTGQRWSEHGNTWMVADGGDWWPSNPCLWKPIEEKKA